MMIQPIAIAAITLVLIVGARAAEIVEPAWVDQRVRQLQPRPEEKRFDEIGWAKDIRDAKELAKQHQRPVFLFTHDGRINIGRC